MLTLTTAAHLQAQVPYMKSDEAGCLGGPTCVNVLK
jgi:hypothetical protein